jgi:hypothetical protein
MKRMMEILQQLMKPIALCNSVHYYTVFGLGTGTWYHSLLLRRPGDKVIIEVNVVARCGAPGIRVASPIRI